MPRQSRAACEGQVLHITSHAIRNRLPFPVDDLRVHFLQLLHQLKRQHRFELFAYALMGNHIHLLLRTETTSIQSMLMCKLLSLHSRQVNKLLGDTGPRWIKRYEVKPIADWQHLICCCLYIDANPWRAKVVEHPADNDWTSYQAHVEGLEGGLLDPLDRIASELPGGPATAQGVYKSWMSEYLRTGKRFKTSNDIPAAEDVFPRAFSFLLRD